MTFERLKNVENAKGQTKGQNRDIKSKLLNF